MLKLYCNLICTLVCNDQIIGSSNCSTFVFLGPFRNGTCPSNLHLCTKNRYCIDKSLLCNNIPNCGDRDNSDEGEQCNVNAKYHLSQTSKQDLYHSDDHEIASILHTLHIVSLLLGIPLAFWLTIVHPSGHEMVFS